MSVGVFVSESAEVGGSEPDGEQLDALLEARRRRTRPPRCVMSYSLWSMMLFASGWPFRLTVHWLRGIEAVIRTGISWLQSFNPALSFVTGLFFLLVPAGSKKGGKQDAKKGSKKGKKGKGADDDEGAATYRDFFGDEDGVGEGEDDDDDDDDEEGGSDEGAEDEDEDMGFQQDEGTSRGALCPAASLLCFVLCCGASCVLNIMLQAMVCVCVSNRY